MSDVWEAVEDPILHNVISVLIIIETLKKARHQIGALSVAQMCIILILVHRHKVSKRSVGQGLRITSRPILDLT